MAKSLRGGLKKLGRERTRNIKENIRYMRIKSLKRAHARKTAKMAPAEWMEFIEI